jgi:hypothetical protein
MHNITAQLFADYLLLWILVEATEINPSKQVEDETEINPSKQVEDETIWTRIADGMYVLRPNRLVACSMMGVLSHPS